MTLKYQKTHLIGYSILQVYSQEIKKSTRSPIYTFQIKTLKCKS